MGTRAGAEEERGGGGVAVDTTFLAPAVLITGPVAVQRAGALLQMGS